jgi:Dynamin family
MTTSEASNTPHPPAAVGPGTAQAVPSARRPVGAILDDVASLAEDFAIQPARTEALALQMLLQVPRNRVAVVGSFAVGKSTLINRLLGEEIVPISTLPNTSQAIWIIAGDRPEIRITWQDGREEVREITATSWADIQPSGDAPAPASIVVTLDQKWLRDCRLELADTPGIDEDAGRFAIARDIAMRSDMVVLVISADSPFSLTERAFLEEEVLARHVPAVKLIVTRLDHVEGQEREVLHTIESRVRAVAPQVPVFPGPQPGRTGTAEIARIRSALTAQVANAERRHDRERQVAARLGDLLNGLVRLAASGAQAESLQAEERRAQEKLVAARIADQMQDWNEIRQALQRRQRALVRLLRGRVKDERGSVLNTLWLDFSSAPDPQEWWSQQLPIRLRRELLVLGRALEQQLVDTFAADLEWLEDQLRRQFDVVVSRQRPDAGPVEPGPIEDVVSGLPSGRRSQLAARLLMALVAALGSIPWKHPGHRLIYGAVAQPAAEVAGDFVADQIAAQHRRDAKPRLAAYLDRNLDAYLDAVTARLDGLYAAEINDLTDRSEAWRQAHLDVLQTPPNADTDWKALMQRARQLLDEVTDIDR